MGKDEITEVVAALAETVRAAATHPGKLALDAVHGEAVHALPC